MAPSKLSLAMNNKIEQGLRDSDQALYFVTDNHNNYVQALRSISIRSGMAIYVWMNERGLVNLKSIENALPRTQKIVDALKYANSSHYFSVYTFPIRSNEEVTELIHTLNSWPELIEVNEQTRFLFIFSPKLNFNALKSKLGELIFKEENKNTYKLRNSIWVLADE